MAEDFFPDPEQAASALEENRDTAPDSSGVSPIKRFSIDVEDSFGKRWRGDFVYKVPNIGEQIKIGRLKANYLAANATADLNAMGLVEVICYLQITLTEKPKWWKPFELYDFSPVMAVYREVTAHEAKFLGRSAGDEGVGDVDQEPEEIGRSAVANGNGEDYVGGEVQATAQRRKVTVSNG